MKIAKLIFGTICSLAAIFLTLVLAKNYLAWDELSIPVFLIYSINSNLDNSEKEKTIKSFGLDSKFELLRRTEEKDIRLFSEASNLLAQLERTSNGNSQTFNFFKLDTPTSRAKKELRLLIEESFTGAERINAFRSVIVVLDLSQYPGNSPDNNKAQFVDDLAYIKDNFGGVGLLVNEKNDIKIDGIRESIHAIKQKTFYY